MKTKQLYYETAYKDTFEAQVLACDAVEEQYRVVLDQTAFYPGGGGQPEDRGTLNGVDVEGMLETDAYIYHLVAEPFQIGEKVVGEVYIEKRIDYMVQHTGEHIVAGILHSWFGYENVGFHLNETYMTADFNGELTKEQVDMLELKANAAIQANVQVDAYMYQVNERLPEYRSKLAFDKEVRLITIEGYDCCACCGTHVRTTGEVGVLKVVDYMKHRGGCRLTILCGRRALYDYQARFDALGEVSSKLSAPIDKVGQAIERLQSTTSHLREQHYGLVLRQCEQKARSYPKDRPLVIVEEGIENEAVKALGDALLQVAKKPMMLIVPEEVGFKYVMIHPHQDIRNFCKHFNSVLEGKGGGKPNICQGSAKGSVAQAKALFYEAFPSWVEEIRAYVPYNEQEEACKRTMIRYMETYDDTLTRENELAHFSSSGWIVNKARTKVLMIHHNLYNKWAWTGGHVDGDQDLLSVAKREAQEETGIRQIEAVQETIFSIDILPVQGHIKKGKYVPAHMHLSIAYLLEADDTELLTIKADENSAVKWIPIEEIHAHTQNEPDRILYGKFMDKIKVCHL